MRRQRPQLLANSIFSTHGWANQKANWPHSKLGLGKIPISGQGQVQLFHRALSHWIPVVTTFPLTILIFAAGYYKISPFQPASSQVLQLELLPASHTTVSLRPRIRSHSSSTGNLSRAKITRALPSTLQAGQLLWNPGSTLPNIGIIWQKRYEKLGLFDRYLWASFPSGRNRRWSSSPRVWRYCRRYRQSMVQPILVSVLGKDVKMRCWSPVLPKWQYSMKYSPSESGHFDGQRGYGYISIEKFIDAARSVNSGVNKPEDYDNLGLPTILNTVLTTAILHAGRISLDTKRPVGIRKDGDEWILDWLVEHEHCYCLFGMMAESRNQ